MGNRFFASSVAAFVACIFSGVSHAAIAQTTTHFDVPAQPLVSAIKEVAAQSNVNVFLDADIQKRIANKESPHIREELTLEQALIKVLEGSGLVYRFLNERTVVLAASISKRPAEDLSDSSESAGAQAGALPQESPSASQPIPNSDGNASTKPEQPHGEKGDRAGVRSVQQLDEVLVTGSHIRGATGSTQLITIDHADIDRSGYVSVGDVVRSIPQNFSGGASVQVQVGAAPGTNGTFSGGSAPNLRGLGAGSTLTLVNGHRLAQDMGYGTIDISLIPVDAIDRIEVLTDGASTIYGSDAVAGVVNFILKKDLEGAMTTASYGRATEGGGGERRISQLVGTRWDTGGVLASYEYDRQDEVDSTQRTFTTNVPAPYSLLPEMRRNSGFLSAHQHLSEAASAHVDALYTSRSVAATQTLPPSYLNTADVKQYAGIAALDIALLRTWSLQISGGIASQRTDSKSYIVDLANSLTSLYSNEALDGRTRSVEINADGQLASLPTGKLRAAIGVGYRNESFNDFYVDGATNAKGTRDLSYAFGELSLPLVEPSRRAGLERLDLTVSARSEHYSDVGGKTVPKVGITYDPTTYVRLDASWGKAFRAPTVSDLHAVGAGLILIQIPDPSSSTGQSVAMIPQGGNPSLTPETANTWNLGFDIHPESVRGLTVKANYYNIFYKSRIAKISNVFSALTDPANRPFVTSSPSPDLQQAFIDSSPQFYNLTGSAYDPSTVANIVDLRPRNVASQRINGVDLAFNQRSEIGVSTLQIFIAGSRMRLRQRTTDTSPEIELSGTSFNPPKLRVRGGASLGYGSWTTTGTVNFTGHSINTYEPEGPKVSSWTTADFQLAYKSEATGILEGIQASLSALNFFNKDPPYVSFESYRTGFNYDSVNATPMGRFVTLQLTKEW